MPVVKQYGAPSVETRAVQGGYISDSAPQAAFGVSGLTEAGAALNKASNTAFEYADKKLTDEADAKALEAYTQYSQKVGAWDQDARSKVGTNAVGVTTRAAKDFGQYAQEIANGLPSEYSRKKFLDLYRRSLTQDLTSLSRFEAQQGVDYRNKVREGVVSLEVDKAQKNWGDFDAVTSSADIVETVVRQQFTGQPKDFVESKVMDARSKTYRGAVEQALQKDPLLAQRLYDQSKDAMGADDMLALDKLLKTPVNEAKARNVTKTISNTTYGLPVDVANDVQAESIRQGVPPQVALVTAKIESGGRSDLKNKDSSAFGVFQHLDKTWASLGGTAENRTDRKTQIELGIKGLKQTTDELRSGLGREPQPWEVYLGHQQGVGGALALLRGGETSAFESIKGLYKDPETARKAIALNGGNAGTTANQFATLWKNKFMAALDKANSPMSLDERLASGKALLGNNPDPELEKAVTANVIQAYNQEKVAKRERENDAMETVYRTLNKGGSLGDVEPQVLMNIDEKSRYDLVKSFQENKKTNWAWYDQKMSGTPEEIMDITIKEAASNLSVSDMNKFMETRKTIKNGSYADNPFTADQAKMIRNYAIEMGVIDSGDKISDSQQASYNASTSGLRTMLMDFKKEKGRAANYEEFRKMAASQFMKVAVDDNAWLRNERVFGFELNGRRVRDVNGVTAVPADVRAEVEAKIRSSGAKVSEALTNELSRIWMSSLKNPNWAAEFYNVLNGVKKEKK